MSENGPQPGRPILPVASESAISAAPLWVPCVDWLRPWHHSDSAAGASPHQRAAVTMSSAATPHTAAATAGLTPRTCARSASKPSVWAAIQAWSTSPSRSSTCSMASNSQTSVPGRMARCRSAIAAVSVRRGSTTMIFIPGRRALASSMRRKATGCAHAGLAPAIRIVSAWSKSS